MASFSDSLLAKIVRAVVVEHDRGRIDAQDTEDAVDSARELGFRTSAVEVEIPGYGDWIITDDGYALAEERVKQDLEDEPELFTPSWLAGYLTMSDTDRRILAGEQADSAAEGLDVSDLEDEIEAVASVQKAQVELEDAEEARDEYKAEAGDDYDDDVYDDLDSAADDAYDALEAAKEGVLGEAREAWASEYAESVEEDLRRDAVGWFRDNYGWDAAYLLANNIMQVDYDKAAAAAVSVDGAAHFLANYDGEVVDVEVDGTLYECYRTN